MQTGCVLCAVETGPFFSRSLVNINLTQQPLASWSKPQRRSSPRRLVEMRWRRVFTAVPWLGRLVAGLWAEVPVSIPRQPMWDLWWTEWRWDRISSEYFGFRQSVSLPQCSTLIFISVVLLLEGQMGYAWELYKKQRSFGNGEHWTEKFFDMNFRRTCLG